MFLSFSLWSAKTKKTQSHPVKVATRNVAPAFSRTRCTLVYRVRTLVSDYTRIRAHSSSHERSSWSSCSQFTLIFSIPGLSADRTACVIRQHPPAEGGSANELWRINWLKKTESVKWSKSISCLQVKCSLFCSHIQNPLFTLCVFLSFYLFFISALIVLVEIFILVSCQPLELCAAKAF